MIAHFPETEIRIPFLYSTFYFLFICSLFVLEGIFLFVPTQIFIPFKWQSKRCLSGGLIPSLILSSLFDIYHWTCSRPENIWNTARCVLNINQAINHLTKDQKEIHVLYHVTGMTFPLFLNKWFLITINNINIISCCIILLITLTLLVVVLYH